MLWSLHQASYPHGLVLAVLDERVNVLRHLFGSRPVHGDVLLMDLEDLHLLLEAFLMLGDYRLTPNSWAESIFGPTIGLSLILGRT